MSKNITRLVVAGCMLISAASYAATPKEAAEKLESFLGKFPDLGPGYAVVVVTPDEVVLDYVDGERDARSGAPLTKDTPIYIASQTKAYMGLLAAKLDAMGVLKLDSKITDHWPDVKFPDGVDANEWTVGDLLYHKVPIEAGYITFMEAYVTELDYKDYPALIAEHAVARDEGFQYANLGYNIYSAILHQVSGKSWQDWLDQELFEPLKLTKTSARTSDFPLDELSWNHTWQGEEKGWYLVRPKTDEKMQSAGGLVTSPQDMGRWLQLQLQGKGPGLTEAVVAKAQQSGVETDPEEPNPYELPCSGYALGWNICDFEGHTLYVHGGGYTGARTIMAFSPDLKVGIGVFSNSDNMTGWLTSRTTVQYLQYLTEHESAEKMAAVRERVYPERIARLLEYRMSRLDEARQHEQWGGWAWQPDAAELNQYLGDYLGDDPRLPMKVYLDHGQLMVSAHSYQASLAPAKTDLFAAAAVPLDEPEPVQFNRNSDGAIESFTWDGTTYKRQ